MYIPTPKSAPLAASQDHLHHPEDDLPTIFLDSANSVIDCKTGKKKEYRQLLREPETSAAWTHSSANEFGRLFQGVGGRIKGTNTCFFIHKHEVPADKRVTYARFVCSERPQKTEVNRTRLTVGGNLINYPGEVSTRTSDLTTFKILCNAVVSDDDACFMGIDVKNFYLNTPCQTRNS